MEVKTLKQQKEKVQKYKAAKKNKNNSKLSIQEQFDKDLEEINRTEKKTKKLFGQNLTQQLEKGLDKYTNKLSIGNTLYQNNRTIQIELSKGKFDNSKSLSRPNINKVGKYLSDTLESSGLKGNITTACLFDEFWHSGLNTKFGDDINIFDPDEHAYDEEYKKEINNVQKFKKVVFYLNVENPTLKKGGVSYEYNDCLWNCINQIIPQYNSFKKTW